MIPATCGLCLALVAQPLGYAETAEPPPKFVQGELLSVGMDFGTESVSSTSVTARLLAFTYSSGGFRAGIAALEAHLWSFTDPEFLGMFLPMRVGVNLLQNPKKTAFFYGFVPSSYAELTVAPIALAPAVAARLAVGCEVDYYGIGIRAEAGACKCIVWDGSFGDLYDYAYVGMRLRLFTASLKLQKDQ